MSGETKTPVLSFPDSAPWEKKPFAKIADRKTTMGNDSELPRVEYEDVIPFRGALNKDVFLKASGKTGVRFLKDDVLFGKLRPYLGNWFFAEFNGLAVGDWWVLKARESVPEFLYALIQSPSFQDLANQSSGSKMPRADWGLVSEATFDIPSSPTEQQSIGRFFRELDALIAEREKALGKLESLKKAMLEKMFPQGDAKVPEVRFKGFEGEWEEKKLGDVCTGFDYGLNVAATKFDGRNRYIRITDIDDDSHAYNVLGAVSPDCNLSESKESIVCKGDILLARTGASVGKSYLYNENDGVMYFAGFLIRAHVSGEYDDFFVFCNTLTERYRQFVELTSQRSGQPGINAAEYKTFSFLTPVELAEQQAIGSFFRSLDALLAARREEAEKLKQLKKAFLERMFA